jgi:rhodanese-related sulfurtransferase/DNA-binding transcriptional ArsR family regulator
MSNKHIKDMLYEQVSRISKALASPKRLEILDMLAQGEKAVESIAAEVEIDIKLASAHLKALKESRLVNWRRDGKRIFYSVSGPDVSQLTLMVRGVAQEHLLELQMALKQIVASPQNLTQMGRKDLMTRAKKGEVIVLDVRPTEEFEMAHLPYARSLPLNELSKRIAELPTDVEIVAYCRGPFCLMSDEAVKILREQGLKATKTVDGVTEWLYAGLAVSTNN